MIAKITAGESVGALVRTFAVTWKIIAVVLYLWSLWIAWTHGIVAVLLTMFLPGLSQVYWYIIGWIYYGGPIHSMYNMLFVVEVAILALVHGTSMLGSLFSSRRQDS